MYICSINLLSLALLALGHAVHDQTPDAREVADQTRVIEEVDESLREQVAHPAGWVVHGRGNGVADETHFVLAHGADVAQTSQALWARKAVVAVCLKGGDLSMMGVCYVSDVIEYSRRT